MSPRPSLPTAQSEEFVIDVDNRLRLLVNETLNSKQMANAVHGEVASHIVNNVASLVDNAHLLRDPEHLRD